MSDDGKSVRHLRLGTDFGVGEQPQAVVPRHVSASGALARRLDAGRLHGVAGLRVQGLDSTE